MIGERIRQKREEMKISQYAVAYCIGMSQAAYSKIERGETEVKVSHLYQIATVLKISVYDLLPPVMENNILSENDYLLKPLVVKIQVFLFNWLIRRRMKKLKEEGVKAVI